MRCPRLLKLLPATEGKTGWPWTEETVPEEAEQISSSLPSISIVTPSYNQAAFLEETIRSVLLQGYPNLEYIVMDGGSTDGSLEIIKKYEKHLTYWTSQKDAGPADAIRKGFERAKGSILAYLNSDDLYRPGAIHCLINRLKTAGADVVYGNTYWIDDQSRILAERRQTPFSRFAYLYGGADLQQPATFWTQQIYRKVGGMDTSFICAFDTDLFARFASGGARFSHIRRFVACARMQQAQLTEVRFETTVEETNKIRGRHASVPVRSPAGSVLRIIGRMQRLAWYLLQGDALWLIGRIPDRLRARTRAATATGPRSKWF